MARKDYSRKKRRPKQYFEEEEDDTVDDMMVAAKYAAQVYYQPPTNATANTTIPSKALVTNMAEIINDEEIRLSDIEMEMRENDSSSSSSSCASSSKSDDSSSSDSSTVADSISDEESVDTTTSSSSGSDDDEDNEDDTNEKEKKEEQNMEEKVIAEDTKEDPTDWVAEREFIEKMQEETPAKNGNKGKPATRSRPKTKHELDAYQTPLQELEQEFELNLNLDHHHQQQNMQYLPTAIQGTQQIVKTSLAGRLQSHMVRERTIIVESFPKEDHSAPLDVGSLLLFRMDINQKEQSTTTSTNSSGDNNKQILIPLGKIFEVFGPVRRPLYTIRLPTPPTPSVPEKQLVPNNSGSSQDSQQQTFSNVQSADSNVQDDEKNSKPNETQEMVLESNGEVPQEEEKQTVDQAMCVDKGKETSCDEKISKETKTSQTERRNQRALPPAQEDPWSHDGKYTRFLSGNPCLSIFYVPSEAKVIDTGKIAKMKTKGCDASNRFDEEIVSVCEKDFSDDEEELLVRRKWNEANTAISDNLDKGNNQQFQRNPNPNPTRLVNRQSAPLPSGFHPSNQHGHLSQQSRNSGPPQTYPNRGHNSVRPQHQPRPPPSQRLPSAVHRYAHAAPRPQSAPQYGSRSGQQYMQTNHASYGAHHQQYIQPPLQPYHSYPGQSPAQGGYQHHYAPQGYPQNSFYPNPTQQGQQQQQQHHQQQQSDTVYYDYS